MALEWAPLTRVDAVFPARFDDVRHAPVHGPSSRHAGSATGPPRQCGRAARQTDSHGERDDDRAEAHRCRPHDRHNDGGNPCSPRAADAIPNSRHEAVRISAAGLLKVWTPIYRDDSGGRRSQLALMPLGAGIRERRARDRSPPGPRRHKAARFTRARRGGFARAGATRCSD